MNVNDVVEAVGVTEMAELLAEPTDGVNVPPLPPSETVIVWSPKNAAEFPKLTVKGLLVEEAKPLAGPETV